jgi:hypothetical protein
VVIRSDAADSFSRQISLPGATGLHNRVVMRKMMMIRKWFRNR